MSNYKGKVAAISCAAKGVGRSLAVIVLVCACSEGTDRSEQKIGQPSAFVALDVYKSPTCGCCAEWIEHLENNGFVATAHHPDDLDGFKREHGIAPAERSCHTAVSAGGYVFEGHIPARYIQQFLAAPVAGARGLAVPEMPVGSPGMEMGERFMPYDVLLLKEDGSTQVYASISAPGEQY